MARRGHNYVLEAHCDFEPRSKGCQLTPQCPVDGANYLATFPRLARKTPMGNHPRGENHLDGGCPFYDTYETRDGKYMSVGALEPQFYATLVKGLGVVHKGWDQTRWDRDTWPEMKAAFETVFKSKTRSEWEVSSPLYPAIPARS